MAEIGSIEYRVSADTAPLLKAEQQISKSADNTAKAFKRTDTAAKQLNTQMTKTAAGVKTATSGMDRLRGAAGNIGFQIQDMAVQLQSGTNAMVVFGQQGSQIAGAFGPGGAIFGAVIAIAAAIGTTLVGSMADAGDQIDIMTDKTEELTAAQLEYVNLKLGEKLAEISEQIAIMKNRLATLANIEARRGKLSKGQQEDLIELRAEYDLLIQTQQKYQDQVDKVSGKQKENQDQIKKTRDVIADLSGEYRVLALQVLGATEEANRLADNLTAQALLGEGATKQGLQEVVAGLQAIRVEREKLQAQQQAQQEQQQGLSFAEAVITRGMTPAERREQDIAKLEELRQQDIANEAVYQQAITSLKDKSAQEQADIERRKNDMILSATGSALNSSLDILRKTAGEQSGIYKAMFVASKAFAIAESIIKIQQGIANAAALPFPANIPAMATVAAATAGIVSTIQGTDIQGRRHGGPVSAGRMYEVNEGGRPEMLTMGSKQYLMPSASGKVTSNRDMMQGGGVVNNINITTPPGMSADTRSTPNASGGQDIDVMISAVAQDIEGRGRVHSAITRATTAGNRQ